jgi:hypothetical protein
MEASSSYDLDDAGDLPTLLAVPSRRWPKPSWRGKDKLAYWIRLRVNAVERFCGGTGIAAPRRSLTSTTTMRLHRCQDDALVGLLFQKWCVARLGKNTIHSGMIPVWR